MSKIAFDIALLLPEEIMDLAISANKSVTDPRCVYRLNKTDVLPHITLVQGVLDEARFPEVAALLNDTAQTTLPLTLKITGLDSRVQDDGYPAIGFSIESDKKVLQLHETLMKQTEAILTSDATEEMFFDSPIRPGSVAWVQNYRAKHSHRSYHPHITISVGGVTNMDVQFPVSFTASRLALCHLGNGNSCRKIFAEFTLTGTK
ncbi:MAG: hypothetical protein COV91_02325 [Candidatus Taylorbacteria bacterium CG11_big_fil_rev_8_21_14_0_20_46_11]|uniref:Phosphoesterase HXTX domain-containing protein n=1 Tax=Candidatus Taylorbacteria bacterium CG11_big_fil_rev_8_21_14_0_20_46_11 TaxID=1975025 RepID=A0A2H0KDU3_9BACT|nr:MAG: hypothetical protein COV91_02325 [Candidatus Taylorbacteria bacterium CG11_big_fil_rev_8_21_14_0_20_46_11]